MLEQKGLIPFLMAGYPSLEASEKLASALIEEGSVALEIGVPFSDPLADGPVIQKAAALALENGTTLADTLAMIARLTKKHPGVPIVVFSYLNPLLQYGVDAYVAAAVKSGVAATLTVDLPPEEAASFIAAHRKGGLKNVFLASPTTTTERLRIIAESSNAFVYYVSRTGVTGEQSSLSKTLALELAEVRKHIKSPIAVGFGIATAEQAAEVAKLADAVVIGSRFLTLIDQSNGAQEAETKVRALARESVAAIRRISQ